MAKRLTGRSAQKFFATAIGRRKGRHVKRSFVTEWLEPRQLLAVGPQLIGINPNDGELLNNADTRHVAPQDLTFRFDGNQVIDTNSLAGIVISRAGADGDFDIANVISDLGTNGQALVKFEAVTKGPSGNGVAIVLEPADLGGPSGPIVTVTGKTIRVEVNTNPQNRSTVIAVVTAINRHAEARGLVVASVESGSNGAIVGESGSDIPPITLRGANEAEATTDMGTSGAVRIRFTSTVAGEQANGTPIAFRHARLPTGAPPQVALISSILTVTLNVTPGSETTVEQLLATIATNATARSRVQADLLVGDATLNIATPSVGLPNVMLQGATDILVQPGYIGVDPNATSQVIVRFAETLVDDRYSIDILGTGANPLRNVDGDPFRDGRDQRLIFDLDLGAQVLAVVPQPVSRAANGSLQQALNQIAVYFNDDNLSVTSVTNPNFYQLIFTNHRNQFDAAFDTVTNTDDQLFVPTRVDYDADADMALLTFANNLDQLAGGNGTFRLRIGTDERFQVGANQLRLPPAPTLENAPRPNLVTDLGTNGAVSVSIEAISDFGSAPRLLITSADRGTANGPGLRVFGNVIGIELNSNAARRTTAQEVIDALNRGANVLVNASRVSGNGGAVVPLPPSGQTTTYDVPGLGSSFATASNLGTLGVQSRILRSDIGVQDYPLAFPGAIAEPGHRAIPNQLHFLDSNIFDPDAPAGDSFPGIRTFNYNFREDYGTDPLGNPLFNLITEEQKNRAREIFEIYASYLGISFVESDNLGLTIVTGDLRALSPGISTGPGGVIGLAGGGMAIMDNAENWNDTFGASDDPQRFSWFDTAMHEIGHLLGLGHTDELAPFTVMNNEPDLQFDTDPEDVFPGDHDLVHGLHLHRPESNDIDLYRFDVTESGLFTAETTAERLTNSSSLDTVLNLYRQNPDGSRQLVASNDDYFSEDSLIKIALTPGIYYVGVTASGNNQYDPDRQDSGLGGRSQGDYQLRLNFRPDVDSSIVDTTGTAIDGDADGVPGGVFNFWFRTGNTLFVDKLTGQTVAQAGGPLGSATTPFKLVNEALAAAAPGTIVRVVGNGGDTTRDLNRDGRLDDGILATLGDNLAYEVGFDSLGRALSDGTRLDVPRSVTMMVDAGAIFKMRRSFITVGSSAVEIDNSGSALQILGTPKSQVIFTSYNNESVGIDTDSVSQTPRGGDWGGIIFQHDLDRSEERFDYERQGIFLDAINFANIDFGGGRVVIDSLLQSVAPIHLVDARPTVSYNTITRSSEAAISANPDSFEQTNFHAPAYQETPFTSDFERVGPDIHGNRLLFNSINALFVRVATPAGNELERLTVDGRWDDTDIVHVVSENLEIQATPGGSVLVGANRQARLDASLFIDPGITVKLDGAGIIAQVGTEFVAEGTLGHSIVMTSMGDDRFGAGGTFDTGNNSTTSSPVPGDWTGLFLQPASHGSLDHVYLAYGGGVTKVGGTFAGFNAIEVHQAEMRMANSILEHNSNGAGGQSRRNRDGRGRNAPGAIYVVGAQPVLLDNIIRNTSDGGNSIGPAININANALNTRLLFDPGRSTGDIDAERRYHDNQGPLIRDNQLVNNDINGMVVRGATLTTETVWDDTSIVHVLFDTIYVPDFHTFGGLRLQSSSAESLVVKLSGNTAGFTAVGRPLDIDDRIGGSIRIIGQPGRPVVLTSLADGSVGAGSPPQNNTANEVVPGRSLPAGSFRIDLNFGPNILANPSVVASIRRAADVWETIIQDPITVTLDIEFGATTGNVLGFAVPETARLDYGLVRNAIVNDARGHESIVSDLPTFAQLRTALPGGSNSTNTVLPLIDIARANARAVGLAPSLLPMTSSAFDPTEVRDASVTIGNLFNTPGGDAFDVTLHEIGHALGFLSGVDAGTQAIVLNPLDMFRVAPGAGSTDFRNTPRILDPSRDAVFYDGGIFPATGLPIAGLRDGDIPLSTGEITGDGYQASHWKQDAFLGGVNIGLMGPTGGSLTDADKRAFDLIGWDVVSSGSAGQWRSVRLEQYSNDRNVEVITESELSAAVSPDPNGTPSTAEFLGQLAPSEKAGDENRRLGFQVHGFINSPTDVDTYSFTANAGTEVWFDIDRTSTALDAVLELVDASGRVIARSDNSYSESFAVRRSDATAAELPGGIARPLDKTQDGSEDFWGTNMRDPGMRVVLPGRGTSTSTYHIRVLSDGNTTGVYQLQLRLRQTDEIPGSTIRYADIRYATNGIEILGQPMHSPLTGETAEKAGDNSSLLAAQPIGNVLQTDRGTLSIAGFLDDAADVDWYQFDVIFDSVQTPFSPGANQYASVTFDLDYADGFARANSRMFVFDSLGQLVLTSDDGKIIDDLAAPGKGADVTDLERGSAGVSDPFIGPVSLPIGSYYVAVTTSNRRAGALDQLVSPGTGFPLVRVEPLDSVKRIAEDHFGGTAITAELPSIPLLFGQNYSVFVPPGYDIIEGETVVVRDLLGDLYTFEFDSDQITRPGTFPVSFTRNNSGSMVTMQLAVRRALLAAMQQELPGTINLGQTGTNGITLQGDVADITTSSQGALYVSRPAIVPYFLNDVNLWVGQGVGLLGGQASSVHMVDPFSGVVETPVGGFGDRHGDLALQNACSDRRLYTFSQGPNAGAPNDGNTGGLMTIDYGSAATTVIGDDGVQTYQINAAGDGSERGNNGAGVGMLYSAMAFRLDQASFNDTLRCNNYSLTELYAIGRRGDSQTPNDPNDVTMNDYTGNILYFFGDGAAGTATSAPGVDRQDQPGDPNDPNAPPGAFIYQGAGTQILERGHIDTELDTGNSTATVLQVTEATTLENGATVFTIPDGLTFKVGNTTFAMDSGPEVRVDFDGASFVSDGQSFTLDGKVFEFNTGPVIRIIGSGQAFTDGLTFTLSSPTRTTIFEIDSSQDGVAGTNEPISNITSGTSANDVALRIADAINKVGMNVSATAVAGRITLIGDTNVTLGAGMTGARLDGTYTVNAGATAIPVEETFTATEIKQAVVDAVTAEGTFTAGFDFERLNFPDAQVGNFSNAPIFTALTSRGEAANTSVNFYAEDTADEIAQRIANAINTRLGANTASASGRTVRLTGAATFTDVTEPFISGGAAPGGYITGMAFLNGTMYVVSETGGLWSVDEYIDDDDAEVSHRLIAQIRDDAGQPIEFAGLTNGPADVENGRYENLLFGIDIAGNLYAFDELGTLQPIFMDGATSVATGLAEATGLAFSPVTENPWRNIGDRGTDNDLGHGTIMPVTRSRNSVPSTDVFGQLMTNPESDDRISAGGNSLHFGTGQNGNYNAPGGTHGTVISNSFSLKDYNASDQPSLYFNYFLATENWTSSTTEPWMQDSFRVYVSTDSGDSYRGKWQLLGTNNSFDLPGADELSDQNRLDEFDITSTLLHDNAGWRQAKIPLGEFAGYSNLRLRFDFATAGGIGLGSAAFGGTGSQGSEGEELYMIDANRIADGQFVTFNSPVIGETIFEFDLGYSLSAADGSQLRDGETFTITAANGVRTFEFDSGNGVGAGRVAIPFTPVTSSGALAATIGAAVTASGLTVIPHVQSTFVNLEGASNIVQGAPAGQSPGLLISGQDGTSVGAVPVAIHADMTPLEVNQVFMQAYADTFTNGNLEVIKNLGNMMRVVGRAVADPGPLGWENGLYADATFSAHDEQTISGQPARRIPAVRAINNSFEGVYLDDFIIGFAGRGEMVTSFGANTDSTFIADAATPGSDIAAGAYQLEIRRSPVIGVPQGSLAPPQALARTFDVTQRLSDGTSLTVSQGSALQPGQTFELSNGVTPLTVRYVNQTIREQNETIATSIATNLVPGTAGTYVGLGIIGDNILSAGEVALVPGLDVDFFRVELAANDRLRIDIDSFNPPTNESVRTTLDSVIRLFDTNGTEVAASDDTPAPGEVGTPFRDPFINFTAARAGTYYVGVSRFPNSDYDPTIPFSGTPANAPQIESAGSYRIQIDVNNGVSSTTNNNEIVVGYHATDSANVIARRLSEAINTSPSARALGISAGMRGNRATIDLFGDTIVLNNSKRTFAVEPNDGTLEAVSLGLQSGSSGTLRVAGTIGDNLASGSAAGDTDRLRLRLVPGDTVRVRAMTDELGSNVSVSLAALDPLDNPISTANRPFVTPNVPASQTEFDPEMVFRAAVAGDYTIVVTGAGGTGNYELLVDVNGGAGEVTVEDFFGDSNLFRDQGQLIIHSNVIRDVSEFGIVVDGGQRDATTNNPHVGPPRITREVNVSSFVPGVVVTNNIVARSGQGGLRFAGVPTLAGQPSAAIPFGRIVNNTFFGSGGRLGGLGGNDVGILVENNASPTLLNNIVANFNVGVQIDNSSRTSVLGGLLLQNNITNNNTPRGLGDFPIVLGNNQPLFVDALNDNFYLDSGSVAIDSSVDSLEDRSELITVRNPLGIPVSPILAPETDVRGQLRVDDPEVDSPVGVGEDVFKDRGALERADFEGPQAVLVVPPDNDSDGLDLDAAVTVVRTFETLSEFTIRLAEGEGAADPFPGIGADDLTVVSSNVRLSRNGVLLQDGIDYEFEYDTTNNVIILRSLAGVWPSDQAYEILLTNTGNSPIQDLAGNPLRPNQNNGTTRFDIILGGSTDFGDAPAPYPTLTADNGASHEFRVNFFLGIGVDSEADGDPSPAATADLDDGIEFPQELRTGFDSAISIIASAAGLLNGWIDYNADGDWNDAGEQVFTNVSLNAGLNLRTITVPLGATPATTFARFRFSSVSNLGPTGHAADGEVEDYQVEILDRGIDFGDAPDRSVSGVNAYPTSLASDGARHLRTPGFFLGNSIDPEIDGQDSDDATGDGSDEDGVSIPATLVIFSTSEIQVVASAAGFLDGWIDFDQRNGWDTNEHIFNRVPLVAGVNRLNISVPASAIPGETFARFRFTAAGINSPAGFAPTGEVEDYQIEIAQPSTDFGDAPSQYPTTLASDGARHLLTSNLVLGALVDDEDNGQPTATATGDGGDEDGVVFTEEMLIGTDVQISVTASGAGLLDAWIDWNRDGVWDDSERIADSLSVSAGTANLAFTVPATAEPGSSFARFRLSAEGGLGPAGAALSGEVEDYEVTVIAGSWHNAARPTDVDNNTIVGPLDAITVINELSNRVISNPVTGRLPNVADPPPYYDVNNDGHVSPLDAIIIINALPSNAQAARSALSTTVSAELVTTSDDVTSTLVGTSTIAVMPQMSSNATSENSVTEVVPDIQTIRHEWHSARMIARRAKSRGMTSEQAEGSSQRFDVALRTFKAAGMSDRAWHARLQESSAQETDAVRPEDDVFANWSAL